MLSDWYIQTVTVSWWFVDGHKLRNNSVPDPI